MKTVLFFIAIIFVSFNSLSAQTMLNGLMDNFRFKKITEGTYFRNSLSLSDVEGSPFLNEEFLPGKIITRDGSVYTEIPLRYNGYTDDLEFQKDKDNFNIDPKDLVKRAEFGGSVFCYLEYFEGDKIKSSFFEILTEGKATLLVKYSVKFLDKEQVKAYAEPKPARFDTPVKDHYLSIDGAPAKLITNKKGLLEMFGDKKSAIESYISKNKVSAKGDDGLTKIVVHYNSL